MLDRASWDAVKVFPKSANQLTEISLIINISVSVDRRPSSETQGQLVGAGKSLNRREKNSGEEKSRTRIRALLFSFLTFLRPNFFLACLDFSLPPPTAPGSPRMIGDRKPGI